MNHPQITLFIGLLSEDGKEPSDPCYARVELAENRKETGVFEWLESSTQWPTIVAIGVFNERSRSSPLLVFQAYRPMRPESYETMKLDINPDVIPSIISSAHIASLSRKADRCPPEHISKALT